RRARAKGWRERGKGTREPENGDVCARAIRRLSTPAPATRRGARRYRGRSPTENRRPVETPAPRPSNFLRDIIAADVAAGTYGGRVATRFPPEPNGFPHIGHAQSICLNFGLAAEFGGTCNLRYDDTNPETERPEYVEALADAVRWLGFEPAAVRFA